MSTSTVSITGNHAASRRRPVVAGDKKSVLDLAGVDAFPMSDGGEIGVRRDSSQSIERSRRDPVVQVRKSMDPNGTITSKPNRRRSSASGKPRWQTVVSVATKNLLLLLLLAGLVQMIRRLYSNTVVVTTVSSDNFDGRIAEVEEFVKKTTKMIQLQVEVVDRKIQKVEEKAVEMESALDKLGSRTNELGSRTDSLEKYFRDNQWLSKGEFDSFFEDYKKAKGGSDENVNLDEVMVYAKKVVAQEIEKHAADGLGKVDYALASGGASVVKHSEPYRVGSKGSLWYSDTKNGVNVNSVKMLRPSFGEPGDCFALKGSSGFVQIKLRTAIVPEAVTLEHVAKSVAYDRSSAPKNCRVSGWYLGQGTTDITRDSEKMFSLAEFTYDLEKSNAQTFEISDSAGVGIINMVRLDFTSNHGSHHTCLYRFRVHGHEPESVVPLAIQS